LNFKIIIVYILRHFLNILFSKYLKININLRAEPLMTPVDDALEWFVSSVIGHVFCQPGLGRGAFPEDLAAFPETLEPHCRLVARPVAVISGMNSLEIIFY